MSGKFQGGEQRADIEAVLGVGGKRSSGLMRRLKWPLILVVLAIAGVAGYQMLGKGGTSASLQYRTDAAARGDITVLVTATGTVQPTNKVDISSELSGIVRTVAVDFNSHVKVGQALAELDTDKLKATVESSRAHLKAARANVAVAEATVVQTKQDLQRKQTLVAQRVASSQDLDTARAAYDRAVAGLESANADVAAAEADLQLNETNLKKSCICSPIDGVVLMRNVDPGQVVASSLQAPVLFTIAEDLSKMEIQVDVDEADVGKVHEGQTASFTVDAYPDRQFEARIRQLRYGSQVVQGVVTYTAVLTADNPELLLRPGMTATAEITVEQVKDVLTVSNEALRFSPPRADNNADNRSFLSKLLPGRISFRRPSRPVNSAKGPAVWVLRNGTPVEVHVKVGVSDGKRSQIVSGPLKAGDAVIVDASARSG